MSANRSTRGRRLRRRPAEVPTSEASAAATEVTQAGAGLVAVAAVKAAADQLAEEEAGEEAAVERYVARRGPVRRPHAADQHLARCRILAALDPLRVRFAGRHRPRRSARRRPLDVAAR